MLLDLRKVISRTLMPPLAARLMIRGGGGSGGFVLLLREWRSGSTRDSVRRRDLLGLGGSALALVVSLDSVSSLRVTFGFRGFLEGTSSGGMGVPNTLAWKDVRNAVSRGRKCGTRAVSQNAFNCIGTVSGV